MWVTVLTGFSTAVIEHYDQKQVGEERVYFHLYFTEGRKDRSSNRAGTWRQKLMQRSWRGAAYWLALHGLISLLSYRNRDNLAPLTMGSLLSHW